MFSNYVATVVIALVVVSSLVVAPDETPDQGQSAVSLTEGHSPAHPRLQPQRPELPATASDAESAVRLAHVRLWDEQDMLWFSTWPGESGALSFEPEAINATGPFRWKTPAEMRGSEPVWEPLVQMFHHAPPNTAVKLFNYTMPQTRIEQVVLEKEFEIDRHGELNRTVAEKMFSNVTAGAKVWFVGKIPIDILSADEQVVIYRVAVDERAEYEVERSVGLKIRATPASEGRIAFTLVVPDGHFTAHNNCALPQKPIEYGYYRVRSETEDELVLDRYNNRIEYLIQNSVVDLEVTFFDGDGTVHEIGRAHV